jgi:hypothetical protein
MKRAVFPHPVNLLTTIRSKSTLHGQLAMMRYRRCQHVPSKIPIEHHLNPGKCSA